MEGSEKCGLVWKEYSGACVGFSRCIIGNVNNSSLDFGRRRFIKKEKSKPNLKSSCDHRIT